MDNEIHKWNDYIFVLNGIHFNHDGLMEGASHSHKLERHKSMPHPYRMIPCLSAARKIHTDFLWPVGFIIVVQKSPNHGLTSYSCLSFALACFRTIPYQNTAVSFFWTTHVQWVLCTSTREHQEKQRNVVKSFLVSCTFANPR